MSNLFYRRPRLLILSLALILVAGLSAFEVLPRREDPELATRFAQIITVWPGASAERVETQVTELIEEEVAEVEEVRETESISRAGISVVTVELLEGLADNDQAWSLVRDRVSDASALLPAGVEDPRFEEALITAYSLIAGIAWTRDDPAPLGLLGRLAEDLEDALRAVPGTESTEVFGDPEEEIRVDVDAARLASLGLTPAGLAADLARADAKVPAGRLHSARSDLLIEVDGELETLERVASIPIRAGTDGTLLRLGDVAHVEKTVQDPPSELVLLSGEPGLAVAARMRSGQRIDRWAVGARGVVDDFAARLPAGVELTVLFDQSTYTAERLAGLFANLGLGALLVMVVILATMGWRSAVLVGTALPLSALMVFAGMRALGIPIHQMSITGLIIALGLLIDNAIVMVDETRHHLGQESVLDKRSIARAISGAVRTLAAPLLGSTLTTVFAFMPLVLSPGDVGDFVGAMSISVILAVLSSFVLSLTVVPALTGLLERRGAQAARGFWSHGVSSARLAAAWRAATRLAVTRPALGIGAAVLLPVLGFWKGAELQEQFFPPAGRDQAQVELRLPEHAPIERTLALVEEAGCLLLDHARVSDVAWFLGKSAPKFYYNMLETENDVHLGSRHAMVQLEGVLTRVSRPSCVEIQDELDRDALSGAQFLVQARSSRGRPSIAPVEIHPEGPRRRDVLYGSSAKTIRVLELADDPRRRRTRGLDAVGRRRPKLQFRPPDAERAESRSGFDRRGASRVRLRSRGSTESLGGSLILEADPRRSPVRVRVDRRRCAGLTRPCRLRWN